MKLSERILALFLAVCLLATVSAVYPAASGESSLRFGNDGKFKIMLFADSQDDEDLEQTTTELMREAIAKLSPDLIIYLGDNTVAKGYDNQKKAIEAVTLPTREAGVPFAIVFGNHDEEQGVEKEDLLDIYRALGCLTYDADPCLHGCGNCNLPVLSSDGTRTAFNLWLIDSGSKGEYPDGYHDYDWVHEDQLEWYKATAAELKAANGGKVVPAMNFQHIIIPEIYDAVHIKVPFSNDKLTYDYCGNSYFKLPVFTRLNGYWLEECCPPRIYDGQLDAWVETGDVIAAFNGHDHNNTLNVNIKGIDIVNVPTVGCNSYSKYVSRGVGLITLDENHPTDYEYKLYPLYGFALDPNSSIPDCEGGKTRAFYFLVLIADMLVQTIFRLVNTFGINTL